MSLDALKPGDMLAGKYRVERVIGEGGMGVVLAATNLRLGQRVAIKLMRRDVINEEAVERFLREARALVRLRSEHVTRVIDVGEAEGGVPFMVMEYLEGSDLSCVVQQRGVIAVKDAVEYLLQACEAIAEAHAAGIIHRDLKPANLFLTRAPDGSDAIKVLDFGISRLIESEDEAQSKKLTATTTVFGSPAYMSPEQMRSARYADARSDIWSLGVILYELLVGAIPFDGATYPDLVLAVNMGRPDGFATRRREVPEGLEAATFRCFEKKPEHRFASVAELAEAIAPFGYPDAPARARRIGRTTSGGTPFEPAAQESSARQRAAGIEPSSGAVPSITTIAGPTEAHGGPHDRRLLLAGAAMGTVGVLIGLFALLRPGGAAPGRSAASPSPSASSPITATATPAPEASTRGAAPDPRPDVEVASALPSTPTAPPSTPTAPPHPSAAPRSSASPRAVAVTPPPAIPVVPTPTAPATTKKSPFDVTIK